MSDYLKPYARMQKLFYDDTPASAEDIVGTDDYHENFPYETHLLHRYGDIRKPVLAEPRGNTRPRILPEVHPNCHGRDDAWFTHRAFFHLRDPRK